MKRIKPSCSICYNADMDTTTKVACCNACEDYCFFTPINEESEVIDYEGCFEDLG